MRVIFKTPEHLGNEHVTDRQLDGVPPKGARVQTHDRSFVVFDTVWVLDGEPFNTGDTELNPPFAVVTVVPE